ncbi:hypothetical protein [Gordonia sihwensis]|uniref:Uncharacterized protein n=1 Tax=Gordonia sihwensis NBRC 108236 TaxID=1223544 RepID=L7LKC3_9ACTN|nr:hypothetical protein [Gordonia sihwensis]GAC61585.1 hypothetical protein GSI01S_19_00490 [Gordonia sihwensis NBRC 108236]
MSYLTPSDQAKQPSAGREPFPRKGTRDTPLSTIRPRLAAAELTALSGSVLFADRVRRDLEAQAREGEGA